jgi:hypothetical protein
MVRNLLLTAGRMHGARVAALAAAAALIASCGGSALVETGPGTSPSPGPSPRTGAFVPAGAVLYGVHRPEHRKARQLLPRGRGRQVRPPGPVHVPRTAHLPLVRQPGPPPAGHPRPHPQTRGSSCTAWRPRS